MKKGKFLALFISLCFLFIGTANAEVQSETLKKACETEKMTCDFEESKETNDLPNIYIFRGDGCSFCKKMLQFFINNYDEISKKVNIVIYEVGANADNWDLYEKVGTKFGDTVSGYPYLVVGKDKFNGYATSYDERIKTAIDELVNSEEKYDVVKEVEAGNLELVQKETNNNRAYVFVFIFGVIIALLAYAGYKEFNK